MRELIYTIATVIFIMTVLVVIASAQVATPPQAFRNVRTATPFQNAPVTVYRDAQGRSVGSTNQMGGVTIYNRGSR